MKYFKNTELAKLHNVSEKTVRNWIQATQDGKLDLQLYEKDGKAWVANTNKNVTIIEQQVNKGKKFKNSRGFKAVTPTEEFYRLYNQKQILDIISNITIHHEVPTQYSYFDGGATYWDSYAHRLMGEETPNILTKTIELLDTTANSIDHIVGSKKINIVDLGPGNGLPIRSTLEHFIKRGTLNRYIAIDTSQEMLDILAKNIKTWFGNSARYEGHVRDVSYERFDDLLVDEYVTDGTDTPITLVYLLGNTLNNFRSPDNTLQTINNSMGLGDLLFYSCYLDTPSTRRYFDFNASPMNQKIRSQLILDLLNIDESLYEIAQVFDEIKRARSISFVPKIDLSITFQLSQGVRHVELNKNEPILLWRGRHQNVVEIVNQFYNNDFGLMQATKSNDQDYLLLVSKLKVS